MPRGPGTFVLPNTPGVSCVSIQLDALTHEVADGDCRLLLAVLEVRQSSPGTHTPRSSSQYLPVPHWLSVVQVDVGSGPAYAMSKRNCRLRRLASGRKTSTLLRVRSLAPGAAGATKRTLAPRKPAAPVTDALSIQ